MPTKRNSAGQQQPYVPAGHGDASGEYGEHGSGSNVHYVSPDDVKRQLGYTPEQPKASETPKELVNKLNGNKNQTEDIESVEYTHKFVENATVGNVVNREAEVKITRGSLSKEEIGEFNKNIQDLFDEFPEVKKFTKINVKNAKASTQGGYVATYGFGKDKSYDLYINAGWLDKTPGERIRDENIRWYKIKISSIEKGLAEKWYVEEDLGKVKEELEKYKSQLSFYENKQAYNVITKSSNRKERLKSLLSHELMHRITQTFDGYDLQKYAGDIEKNNALNARYREIQTSIKDAYLTALKNGDAGRISTYATTSRDEFISEANSQISLGIETPEYIKNVIRDMKNFLRSEK